MSRLEETLEIIDSQMMRLANELEEMESEVHSITSTLDDNLRYELESHVDNAKIEISNAHFYFLKVKRKLMELV